MKVSLNWLSQYVDLSGLSPQTVAEKLTMGAFEVEEITVHGADLEGPVVVGEIMEIHPHPNADKIRLTRTRVQKDAEPLDIVCGAQNIEVGQIIAVALPGARVVNRHDGSALHIKASAIRGVKSNGMLCSAPELGLLDTVGQDGILILARRGVDATEKIPALGSDATALLNLKPDYILHVEPRSNRGDALSIKGLAREVAALFERETLSPLWKLESGGNSDLTVSRVDIENTEDCSYFSLIPISGIKVGPSHPDILAMIEAIGVRPVNNVVDITNYVMHELGQPLHAYDGTFVEGDTLSVRRAKGGEKLTTLDGKERELTSEVLVIADDRAPVGLAGIMGGKDSEMGDESTSILLEAACFTPAVVRRGSRLLGLSSDASLRFERGIDAASVLNAARRAAFLIGKYCASENLKIGPELTAGSDTARKVTVDLRLSQIKRILDLDLPAERVEKLLQPLGFVVEKKDAAAGDLLQIAIPSFRQEDVKREIDLIEEVCRLNGYDAIEAVMPRSTACGEKPDDTAEIVASTLAALGLSEAWLSSLVPESESGVKSESLVQVLNPLSKDHKLLRQSLVPGLVNAMVYNQDRGQKNVWLFELGRAYIRQSEGTAQDTGVVEQKRVAGVVSGCRVRDISQSEELDYFDAKGVVENLLAALGISMDSTRLSWQAENSELYPWLHPYRSAVLSLNRPPRKGSDRSESEGIFGNPMVLGYVGEMHPAFADKRGAVNRSFVFELDLDRLKAERKPAKFSEVSQTPAVNRDLTADFACEKNVQHQSIERLITKGGGPNLRGVELVGIYRSQKEARESLTYRLTFQHPVETLVSDEVDKILASLRESLSKELGASFRL